MKKRVVYARKPRPRKYRGEAEADLLIAWLNEENPSDEKQEVKAKVERTMELLRRMREKAQTFAGWKPSAAWLRDQKEVYEFFLEYTHSDRVDYDPALVLKWSVVLNKEASLLDVPGAAEAAATIRDLDKMGVLAQIRKCECSKTFFARFPRRERDRQERFCSAECQMKFWEASEERIKQKRKKAKEYYELHKKPKIKWGKRYGNF